MKHHCLNGQAELVKIYGESATRAAKRRYCNRACVDKAKPRWGVVWMRGLE